MFQNRTLADVADIVKLSEVELRDIERPQFKRKTQRGLVEWHNHSYFHLDFSMILLHQPGAFLHDH